MLIELEYSSTLAGFEKDILYEKLKGITDSFESFLGSNSVVKKLENELIICKSFMVSLSQLNFSLEASLAQTTTDRDAIQKEYTDFMSLKTSAETIQMKAFKLLKDKHNSLQAEYNKCIEERELFKIKNSDIEKKYSDISEELQKLQHKLKQTSIKIAKNDEENFCIKCQKIFFESENYNWSCKTHQSNFYNDIYWCCGKTGKNAVGCIVSKHMVKDEDIDNSLSAYMPKFCVLCKKPGHLVAECPKDPNIKTNADLVQERLRLENIHNSKKKNIQTMSERITETLSFKQHYNSFDKDVSSEDQEDIEEGVYFKEIFNLKEILDLNASDYRPAINPDGQQPDFDYIGDLRESTTRKLSIEPEGD